MLLLYELCTIKWYNCMYFKITKYMKNYWGLQRLLTRLLSHRYSWWSTIILSLLYFILFFLCDKLLLYVSFKYKNTMLYQKNIYKYILCFSQPFFTHVPRHPWIFSKKLVHPILVYFIHIFYFLDKQWLILILIKSYSYIVEYLNNNKKINRNNRYRYIFLKLILLHKICVHLIPEVCVILVGNFCFKKLEIQ